MSFPKTSKHKENILSITTIQIEDALLLSLDKLRLILNKILKHPKIESATIKDVFKKSRKSSDDSITAILIKDDCIQWSVYRKVKQRYEWLKSNSVILEAGSESRPKTETISHAIKIIENHLADFKGEISYVIPANKLLIHILDFPTKDFEELEGMVQLQVDKVSPYPTDETIFSYEVLSHFGQDTKVLLSITKKSCLNDIKALIDETALNVQRLDIEPMALWSFFTKRIDVQHTDRNFLLYTNLYGGVLLCFDDDQLIGYKNILSLKELQEEEIKSYLEEEFKNMFIAMELSHNVKAIKNLYLYLKLSEAERIAEDFRKKFPRINITLAKDEIDITRAAVDRFIIFRENQKFKKKKSKTHPVVPLIDFVPEEWRKIANEMIFRTKLLKVSILLLALWLITVIGIIGLYSFEKRKTDELTSESSTLSIPANEVRALQQRVREFEKYVDRSKSLLDYLLEITKLMPQEVTLTSFQYAKGRTIIIRGESLAANPILDFKQALDKSPLFPTVDMGNIMPAKRKDTTVQSFQMTIHLEKSQNDGNNQNKSQKMSGTVKIGTSSESETNPEKLK